MSISPARRRQAFADSRSFAAFVATTTSFTDEYQANHAAATLDDRDRELLAGITRPVDVLAIVEDWCPDVVATLPVLARVAEETPSVALHVLVRDEAHRDIADAYPHEGRSHIPTYVLSDREGTELGVIIERTPAVHEHVRAFVDGFLAEHPEIDPAAFPAGLSERQRAELTDGSLRLRRELRDLERRTLIERIAELAAPRPVPAV